MKRAQNVLAHCSEGRPEAHRLPNMQSVFLHADLLTTAPRVLITPSIRVLWLLDSVCQVALPPNARSSPQPCKLLMTEVRNQFGVVHLGDALQVGGHISIE